MSLSSESPVISKISVDFCTSQHPAYKNMIQCLISLCPCRNSSLTPAKTRAVSLYDVTESCNCTFVLQLELVSKQMFDSSYVLDVKVSCQMLVGATHFPVSYDKTGST